MKETIKRQNRKCATCCNCLGFRKTWDADKKKTENGPQAGKVRYLVKCEARTRPQRRRPYRCAPCRYWAPIKEKLEWLM